MQLGILLGAAAVLSALSTLVPYLADRPVLVLVTRRVDA